jgi:hypothetical protein
MLTLEQISELEAAAALGALLMDAEQPGWAERVNPSTLRMQSTEFCILGQSMPNRGKGLRFSLPGRSSYSAKLDQLGVALYDSPRYGFALTAELSRQLGAWNALGDAWQRQIQARTTTLVPADVQEPPVLA